MNDPSARSLAETALLEVSNLSMRYGARTVVDKLSFSITANSTVGFLGPNGAGKSTTMRMLTGFRIPSSGTASIAGHDILTERRKAQAVTGYLPESPNGFDNLTTGEFLTYCCEARGLYGPDRLYAVDRVCEDIALAPVMGSSLRWLSKGWRQRAWLAQALLHDPKVLILDEPTDGLDPVQKRAIRRLIKNLAVSRVIILSTHILEEAEEICDRAIIIDRGSILVDDQVRNLLDNKGRLAPLFYDLVGGGS